MIVSQQADPVTQAACESLSRCPRVVYTEIASTWTVPLCDALSPSLSRSDLDAQRAGRALVHRRRRRHGQSVRLPVADSRTGVSASGSLLRPMGRGLLNVT